MRDRGAAMVEFAFVLVLLVMLLVGIVTSAVSFGRSNSIQNAAREASRFGATLPGPVDSTWLGTVRDVARAAASGDLDSSVPGQFICVAHLNGATIMSLEDDGGSVTFPNSECFSDGRPADEVRVQVLVERDSTIQAVVFSTDIGLTASAAARYER
ncbi:MAG: TadE/TadG family type IV pilus assembly protein [Acidimicrobiia bacterium]